MLTHNNKQTRKRYVYGRGICKCSDKRFIYGKGFADVAQLIANTAVLGKNMYNIVKDSKDLNNEKEKEKHRLTKLVDEIIGSGFKTI